MAYLPQKWWVHNNNTNCCLKQQSLFCRKAFCNTFNVWTRISVHQYYIDLHFPSFPPSCGEMGGGERESDWLRDYPFRSQLSGSVVPCVVQQSVFSSAFHAAAPSLVLWLQGGDPCSSAGLLGYELLPMF